MDCSGACARAFEPAHCGLAPQGGSVVLAMTASCALRQRWVKGDPGDVASYDYQSPKCVRFYMRTAIVSGPDSGSADEIRMIKKYPNRRLYDTAISSYITLEDVQRLVLSHIDFRVTDAKSGEDITRNILLQIIVEREEGGEPIFSTDVLQQIIRFYGDALQGMIASYLDKSMNIFVKQQHALRQQMQNVVSGDPIAFVRELTEQNISLWKEIQEGFFRTKRAARRASASERPQSTTETSQDRNS